jgi:transcription antitermination factor NusG
MSKKKTKKAGTKKKLSEYKIGDHVRIKSGQFPNAEGTVSGKTADRVLVKVDKLVFGARCRTFGYNAGNLEYLGPNGPCPLA